jgi:hypothetical protein
MAYPNTSEKYTCRSVTDADSYIKCVENRIQDCDISTRIEPRARKADIAQALSFEVFDPLWLLTRQWQYGRFKGNDCGSPITTKVKVSKRRLDTTYPNCNKMKFEVKKDYSTDTPMEYEVEKQNRNITPFIRLESAIHFKKMIEIALEKEKDKKEKCENTVQALMKAFVLDPFIPFVNEKDKTVETLKTEQNENLKRLYITYGKRMFDGYKLFADKDSSSKIKTISKELKFTMLRTLFAEYKKWFIHKYLPITDNKMNCWNEEELGYDVAMGEDKNIYEAEDYHTGKLSWFSFDAKKEIKDSSNKEKKFLSYIPVQADFPGAPKQFLWEFEDANVQLGQIENDDFSLLANAVVMQYTTMYGNDWMVTPLETETGTILDVEGIVITDTFGERVFINTSAEETDKETFIAACKAQGKKDKEAEKAYNAQAFTDRWSLFGTTLAHAYEENNFTTQKGLLFPPTLPRCEEGDPIEEVQFLRDEMANMLWGVETVIDDGCGGTISGKSMSDNVLAIVDAQKGEAVVNEEEYDYSFLVQNRVPLHWIPFIPQKIEGESRDIRFRRGRMPIFFNNSYNPVRPSTQLLGIKENEKTKTIEPLFINEEEITGYGIKLIQTAQRTRWFYGESFTWTGFKKVISMYQANSGLMFDELIEKSTGKSIVLHPDVPEEVQEETS